MSKTWKWIIGITVGLVILFGVGFVLTSYFGFGHMAFDHSSYYGHPMMDDHGFGGRTPMDGYRGFRHPMMGGYGFFSWPLLFFGGLLRLLFPLLVLGTVGYFAYKKGKKDGITESTTKDVPASPSLETVGEE
jgi:hypothetical protein